MNIFALHIDPKKAAEYHCDKHVVKMILESAQMASTVFDKYGNHEHWMLKPCWHNHPCTLWAGDSKPNLKWLIDLGYFLCKEYEARYNKKHSYYGKFLAWRKRLAKSNVPNKKFTAWALAVPPQYKEDIGSEYNLIEAINAYRLYYVMDKSRFAKWKLGNKPAWFITE